MRIQAKGGWGLVSKPVMVNPAISPQAKGLYALLATYANKDRACWPSVNLLAEQMGASNRSVIRWLVELSETGVLDRRRRTGTSSRMVLRDYIRVIANDTDGTYEGDTSVT